MTEVHPNWKSLPVEILHEIFQLIPAKKSYHFSLVCKSWLQPAQSVLYSKVEFRSLMQLKKFQTTIENNSNLGNKVKEFLLDSFLLFTYNKKERPVLEIFNILTNLLSKHLPNLEVLEDQASDSYIPTLEALLNSQLNRLKRIITPNALCKKTEITNYVTCALMMKDRLENIYISDKSEFIDEEIHSGQSFFDRLYSRLHQFVKLEEITIEKSTEEEIYTVDYVLEACKSLRNISFDFSPPEDSDLT